jgi:hypothetical protein
MRVYVTYCSAQKDESLRNTDLAVYPDKLYQSARIRRFMDVCKRRPARWAILSDKYGIWFPEEKRRWYEKSPDFITQSEFGQLLANFDVRLIDYDPIYFYTNPIRLHSFYRRLLGESALKSRIIQITRLQDIA